MWGEHAGWVISRTTWPHTEVRQRPELRRQGVPRRLWEADDVGGLSASAFVSPVRIPSPQPKAHIPTRWSPPGSNPQIALPCISPLHALYVPFGGMALPATRTRWWPPRAHTAG